MRGRALKYLDTAVIGSFALAAPLFIGAAGGIEDPVGLRERARLGLESLPLVKNLIGQLHLTTVMVVIAFLLTQIPQAQGIFKHRHSAREKLLLMGMFVTVLLMGFVFGLGGSQYLSFGHAAIIAAGLLAGVRAGLVVGILGTILIFWLGEITQPFFLMTGFVGGVLAGLLHGPWRTGELTYLHAAGYTLFYEIVVTLFGMFAIPVSEGYFLDLDVTIPGVIGTSLNVGLFVLIVDRAVEAQQARTREARREEMLVETRLKYLQAQVNPHFLFNALNTIQSFVRKDSGTAVKLIQKLSVFLRRALAKGGDFVTVAEELEQVQAYMDLERARFGEKLLLKTEVESRLDGALVPNMIIQPLVENALKHGIGRRRTGGTITITAFKLGTNLVIEVKDDGKGMSAERLQSVLMEMESEEPGGGIGLKVVNQRLKTSFGPAYGLQLDAGAYSGTRVTMRIPL